jgi:protein-L-isoaspartate(D-aspartate) O-methyltransferase
VAVVDAPSSWEALFAEVPRVPFIPDTIWVDEGSGDALVALSKHTDPNGWHAVVSANAPVVTQVNFGDVQPGQKGSFPSSSCSQPSIVADMLEVLDVRPGQSVLEIGTGTGWNAALLSRCVGEHGRVVTIEVDPRLAQDARRALTNAGYDPLVITGDGLAGYSAGAPYDRVISTASIREVVPRAWLDQLRPTSRLVTPWGTDWSNGVMLTLTLAENGAATGRFSGDLAFMRIRSQRRALYGWEPTEGDIERAEISTTQCRGSDLDRMLNPDKGTFAIGARLACCCLVVEWNKHGELTTTWSWTTVQPSPGHSWMPISTTRPPSPCGSSGRASCGTRPKPPTTGGTNTANQESIGLASRSVTGGSGCGSTSPITRSVC